MMKTCPSPEGSHPRRTKRERNDIKFSILNFYDKNVRNFF